MSGRRLPTTWLALIAPSLQRYLTGSLSRAPPTRGVCAGPGCPPEPGSQAWSLPLRQRWTVGAMTAAASLDGIVARAPTLHT